MYKLNIITAIILALGFLSTLEFSARADASVHSNNAKLSRLASNTGEADLVSSESLNLLRNEWSARCPTIYACSSKSWATIVGFQESTEELVELALNLADPEPEIRDIRPFYDSGDLILQAVPPYCRRNPRAQGCPRPRSNNNNNTNGQPMVCIHPFVKYTSEG
eukprot:TRINITY_DN8000_c0_g1_i1.p1 TRINITY_DN8000_c0_g1~~TRINITY_DN8000_c0_g1_i1.p1  ORF type:complete len:164 (-),score=16.31 TRINITY_DN8000_c0_g1_i1:9-500(-)